MGARAHGHRREGRAIRKRRRQLREVYAMFVSPSEAARRAMWGFNEFSRVISDASTQKHVRETQEEGALELSGARTPHPSHSGVGGGTGRYRGVQADLSWIDEATEAEERE